MRCGQIFHTTVYDLCLTPACRNASQASQIQICLTSRTMLKTTRPHARQVGLEEVSVARTSWTGTSNMSCRVEQGFRQWPGFTHSPLNVLHVTKTVVAAGNAWLAALTGRTFRFPEEALVGRQGGTRLAGFGGPRQTSAKEAAKTDGQNRRNEGKRDLRPQD